MFSTDDLAGFLQVMARRRRGGGVSVKEKK